MTAQYLPLVFMSIAGRATIDLACALTRPLVNCLFVSSYLESDVADFDGRSSLLYRFNQKLMTTFKDVISLKFKSMQSDGVLFHGEGQRGDYITLELQKGRLALYINLGMDCFPINS